MSVVALLGVALFMLTSLVVGSRLAWLYLGTRKLPELLMATALLCSGFLAFAVGTAGKLLLEGTPSLRSSLTLTGLTIEYVGDVAMALFAWRVFHPKKRWAAVGMAAVGLVCVGGLSGEVLSGEYLRYADTQPIAGLWVPLGLAARALCPTWLAFECLRFHGQLRRRATVGLADPLVVRRVLLWGVAMTSSAVAYGVPIAHRLHYGTGLREHTWALSLVSLLATASAVSIWSAFFSSGARSASASLPPASQR
jgi:hypothetical protein